MYRPNCGAINDHASRFCVSCGTALDDESKVNSDRTSMRQPYKAEWPHTSKRKHNDDLRYCSQWFVCANHSHFIRTDKIWKSFGDRGGLISHCCFLICRS